jgi:hypothetical protein
VQAPRKSDDSDSAVARRAGSDEEPLQSEFGSVVKQLHLEDESQMGVTH